MFYSGRNIGKQKAINDIVDSKVLEGQHVHTIGPEGWKCFGGHCEENPNFGKPPPGPEVKVVIDEWLNREEEEGNA